MKLVVATHNAGKLRELSRLCAPLAELISQTELNIAEIEETGLTFVENALLKARHAARFSGLPALADDSGLVIPALNGEPGLYSARYAGHNAPPEARIQKVLDRFTETGVTDRKAFFYTILVLLKTPDDPAPLIGEGRWWGEILTEPRGTHGFGYDPIFWVPTHHCSAAELLPEVKNTISHRARAFHSMALWLSNTHDQYDPPHAS